MSREAKSAAIVAACFAVVAGLVLWFINDAQTELENLNTTIAGLEASITDLEAKVAKRPELERELEKIQENLKEYIKILPSAQVATPERLQELVQEKLDRASVQIQQYIHKKASTKKSRSAFEEIDLTLQARGRYDNFVNFLNSLEKHETFLRVNSFSCRPTTGANTNSEDPELQITLNVSTFRYQPNK